MKKIHIPAKASILYIALLVLLVFSCKEEIDEFPITNDLRVIQVKSGNEIITNGATDLSVVDELELIFSHGLDAAAFEAALTITPSTNYTVAYDQTGSIATISFHQPLEYELEYTVNLPAAIYGAGGQASVEDFTFSFTTISFDAPTITLSTNSAKFFEGEKVMIRAKINMVITKDVMLDLVFNGSAIGDGTDYAVNKTSLTILAGNTSDSTELVAVTDGSVEGEETIIVTISNLINAEEKLAQQLTITLGDVKPALELKGVMELNKYIGGTDGQVRAVHLIATEDIAELSVYGIEVASNGAAPNPADIDYIFPVGASALAGDNILVIRDLDVSDAQAFFGDYYNDFIVFETGAMTQNGDDAILLYNNGIAIESFGEPGVDGTDTYWEYLDSWAYKLAGEWIYAGVGCVANGGGETNATTTCKYPFAAPLQIQGISALVWDGSGTNGGKFVHVRANRDIADLSRYGVGIANNGGGTDGSEFGFPQQSVKEGDQILVAREPETIATYLGTCYGLFDYVYQSDAMQQNGDDAFELFDGAEVIETYGDANVDGTDQIWEYTGSWAYKVGGGYIYGGLDCAATATSNQSSSCPYLICD